MNSNLFGLGKVNKKARKKDQEKPKKGKEKSKAVDVETIAEPVKFLRRFKNMVGKKIEARRLLTFIKSLQKAIHERRIRKGDPFSKEIEQAQGIAVSTYQKTTGKYVEVKPQREFIERLKTIAVSQKIRPSIVFLKRFVSLIGKPWHELINPLKRLAKSYNFMYDRNLITTEDKYYPKVKEATFAMQNAWTKRTSLKIPAATLNGLNGIIADEGGAGFL